MDYHALLIHLQSALVPLVTFVVFLLFAMIRGRRAITSLILGLYFALLISLKFPYYEKIYAITGKVLTNTTTAMIVFVTFTTICSLLMDRLLFYRVDEAAFAGIGKKILLALFATILVMIFSFHVLPVTNLIDPGASAGYLFSSSDYFFWWLIAPLIGLFFI